MTWHGECRRPAAGVPKVGFEQRKCTLYLNGTAYSQIYPLLGADIRLRFLPFFQKVLFSITSFGVSGSFALQQAFLCGHPLQFSQRYQAVVTGCSLSISWALVSRVGAFSGNKISLFSAITS
nr:hypothetical protein [uncultured Agathobaculum sp.]